MTYNPFERGPRPVGVRTDHWLDSARDRSLPVEIWYPADERHAGADLDPATQDTREPTWLTGADGADAVIRQAAVRDAHEVPGPHPLVLLIHGWAGYRQESSFVATHLASHGYIVVAPDIAPSTFPDVDAFLTTQEPAGNPSDLIAHFTTIANVRKMDIPFLIDAAVDHLNILPDAIGITGASYGGWTSLEAPAVDPRIAASVPMCPAGGRAPIDSGILGELLDWDWHRPVPTLMLTADRDALLPLDGQLKLLRRIPSSDKQMVVLANADHNHFVDDVETVQQWLRDFCDRLGALYPAGPGDWPLVARSVVPDNELCPGETAQLAWRGLITAHMDAHLRGDTDARNFIRRSLETTLADRGIEATVITTAVVTRDHTLRASAVPVVQT